ncbi:MAG TPA: SgcJ/EcaC family oxidoreductase [Candidatus Binatia bacterium]|nr:SgcJ/EcaC family oxidoreductase [Candidatus Binatia bacterium]
MTKTLRVAFLAFILIAARSEQAAAFGAGGGVRSDVKGDAEIRKLYETFVEDWNKHNVNGMADLWAVDGDHVEPDGNVAKGREEVRTLFTKQHGTVFHDTKLDLKIAGVWFISNDVALVDGTYSVKGIIAPTGEKVPERRGLLTSVLMREGGKWWIAASRLMIPTTLPYKKEDAAEKPQ